MPAVSDSSPLILYARIGRLDLLHSVFEELLIPPAVWQEIVDQGGRPGAAEVARTSWVRQLVLPARPSELPLPASLGQGEREAVTLAMRHDPPVPVLLDDLRARQVAKRIGLVVIGCGGIAALAKDAGLVSAIRPVLERLRLAGLYLSNDAMERLLQVAGER